MAGEVAMVSTPQPRPACDRADRPLPVGTDCLVEEDARAHVFVKQAVGRQPSRAVLAQKLCAGDLREALIPARTALWLPG